MNSGLDTDQTFYNCCGINLIGLSPGISLCKTGRIFNPLDQFQGHVFPTSISGTFQHRLKINNQLLDHNNFLLRNLNNLESFESANRENAITFTLDSYSPHTCYSVVNFAGFGSPYSNVEYYVVKEIEKLYRELRRTRDKEVGNKLKMQILELRVQLRSLLRKANKKLKKEILTFKVRLKIVAVSDLRDKLRSIVHLIFKNMDDESSDSDSVLERNFRTFNALFKSLRNERKAKTEPFSSS